MRDPSETRDVVAVIEPETRTEVVAFVATRLAKVADSAVKKFANKLVLVASSLNNVLVKIVAACSAVRDADEAVRLVVVALVVKRLLITPFCDVRDVMVPVAAVNPPATIELAVRFAVNAFVVVESPTTKLLIFEKIEVKFEIKPEFAKKLVLVALVNAASVATRVSKMALIALIALATRELMNDFVEVLFVVTRSVTEAV